MNNEKIIRIVWEKTHRDMVFQVAETAYEFGSHYVAIINGHRGFHSTDFDRVRKYLEGYIC